MLKLPQEYDEAVLGIGCKIGEMDSVAYGAEKCIKVLQEFHGMEENDAIDFFHYNILGSYVGPRTPFFIWETIDITELEEEDGD